MWTNFFEECFLFRTEEQQQHNWQKLYIEGLEIMLSSNLIALVQMPKYYLFESCHLLIESINYFFQLLIH